MGIIFTYDSIVGTVLLSHVVTHAVPSAMKDLTSVFGMGTGVPPSLSAPTLPQW